MRRRTAVLALAAVALTGATLPADAAKKKPKPKPIVESYSLTLLPDPSPNAGLQSCGLLPGSTDEHPFTVPAAGTLDVQLKSDDPTTTGMLDWDLHLLDADGELAASTGGSATEAVNVSFKKKSDVVVQVCNLAGQPQGDVTITFTYK